SASRGWLEEPSFPESSSSASGSSSSSSAGGCVGSGVLSSSSALSCGAVGSFGTSCAGSSVGRGSSSCAYAGAPNDITSTSKHAVIDNTFRIPSIFPRVMWFSVVLRKSANIPGRPCAPYPLERNPSLVPRPKNRDDYRGYAVAPASCLVRSVEWRTAIIKTTVNSPCTDRTQFTPFQRD